MAKSKNRRKVIVFSVIVVALLGLTALVIFKKRDVVVTVQTEKVTRRNLTEIVTANGKIQPVLQVKISAEVSGEIIDLPVKEGQKVTKGTLLVKVKPDLYIAGTNQANASFKSAEASSAMADANLRKAEAEYRRNQDLFRQKLVSDSTFDEVKAAYDVAKAQLDASVHQMAVAKAGVDSANDALEKTTIVAPLDGTISKLNSRLGERVLGTIQNIGTEIMTISDLNEMEARVDIGESDVVRIAPNQQAKLEVDAFKNRKFNGIVTQIANSSKDTGMGSGNQEATKFEVQIRIQEKEGFRPGMSVTSEIETAHRTNALTVPFASVTTRPPKDKDKDKKADRKMTATKDYSGTNATIASTNSPAPTTNAPVITNLAVVGTNATSADATNVAKGDKKSKEAVKAIEVVFVREGDHVNMVPVKIGISDDNYWEITEGLKEGQEVVSGSFRAITRELEDGKKVRQGPAKGDADKDKEAKRGD